MTSSYAVLALMGPQRADVLSALTTADVSNAGFPFASARRISVAGAPVLALRVTYVGELGWELHMPVEFAAAVYEAVMAAGAEHGIVNAGYRAIESLRLEKGYRAWGADIGPDHSPLVAGLDWAVKLKSNTPFQGREALVAQAAKPLPRQARLLYGRPERHSARPGNRFIATASGWAGCQAADLDILSVNQSVMATCVNPTPGWSGISCFRGATSSRSQPSVFRPR